MSRQFNTDGLIVFHPDNGARAPITLNAFESIECAIPNMIGADGGRMPEPLITARAMGGMAVATRYMRKSLLGRSVRNTFGRIIKANHMIIGSYALEKTVMRRTVYAIMVTCRRQTDEKNILSAAGRRL